MIEVRARKSFRGGMDSAAFELDVQFRTEAGIAALFGPSGAGKTLTLDAIAGFIRLDDGRILVDDVLLYDGAAQVFLPPRERRCGYVFQNYALFPHMTLRENLLFAALRLPRLERRQRVGEMLERFHLSEMSGRRPHELSGGQKQRGSIARALLAAPRLLLLDEPARGLDPVLRAELYDLLAQVRAEFQTPVLLVTHDLEECFQLGEEVFVLQNGAVVQAGTPLEVLDRPVRLDVARLLGRANLVPVEIVALDPGNNTSRLRCFPDQARAFEIAGPYFPGHLNGDRVTVCVRPEQLKAGPRGGGAPLALQRVTELPAAVRLFFEGGLVVEMPRAEYLPLRQNRDWAVEFPADALRIL